MFSKISNFNVHEELKRSKEELARQQRKTQLLEQRLRNNQQVFVDFESIAQAVSHLIVCQDTEGAVAHALNLIGEGSGLDRIYILKCAPRTNSGCVIDQVESWVNRAANVKVPDFQALPVDAFFPTWQAKFGRREPVFGSLENAPDIEHLTLTKQGVLSFLWIPLFLGKEWWGVMGFDQVSRRRVWYSKEVSAYELLATSVMEFIRRQQLEKSLQVFQERYDMASRAGQVGVWDWDIEKNRVFLDNSIKSMAGYRKEELGDDLVNWEEVFLLADKVKWVEELNIRILNGEKDFELEHWIRHANGRLLDAYSRGKVIYDKTGNAIRILGTTTDITHLKAIQNDLRTARDLAEEGSRAKSEFMAKMSHEIRTPLNGVLGFATLLKHTELNAEQKGYLNNLETSSRLLLSMVNNILDFAKIEAGKLDLEQKPFRIKGSIETILQVFGDSVISKGLKMEYLPGENLPESVITDPLRIQQVILNLIGNAVKFTEQGNIQVFATWKKVAEGKGRLRIVVKDTGIGIESSRLKAIFEPFTQADSSMTRRFGGSGLGLTICQNILQVMGSRLEVTSQVGKGSEFSFEILVEEAPVNAIVEAERVRTPHTQSTFTRAAESVLAQRGKTKILLAEDNALNQQVISKLLNRLGYNAVLVEDGQEAFNALSRWHFDLVFMDIMMPVLDGISATKLIRETLPPAKQPVIIALTANSSEEDIHSCLAVGMNDFLSKPVELEILERTLLEHLNPGEDDDNDPGPPAENTIIFGEILNEAEDFQESIDSFEHFDPEFMRKLIGCPLEPEVQDEFCIDAVEIFLDSTGDVINSIVNDSRAGNWKGFERAVHSLKGTAKTVGALILGNQALQLELWLKEGREGNRNEDIAKVAEEYKALCKELSRYRSILLGKNRRIS